MIYICLQLRWLCNNMSTKENSVSSEIVSKTKCFLLHLVHFSIQHNSEGKPIAPLLGKLKPLNFGIKQCS